MPRAHVLVVDDEQAMRELLGLYLDQLDCSYDYAENGEQGLEMYRQNKYDLIFSDNAMPLMNGMDMTRAIRDLEKASGESIPIIALTGSMIPSEISQLASAGMNNFVAKPFKIPAIQKVLDGWIKED